MNAYTVQHGDSPASIAARFAGCPKCAIDLVNSNSHKPTVTFPNGFKSFRTLDVGEVIRLPEKWFNGQLDGLPPAYFAALPYADGVTRGALGTLGDFPDLDVATSKVGALAAMDDLTFNQSVGSAGSAIDASVREAYGSSNPAAAAAAQAVQDGTKWAWNRNLDLTAALAPGAPIDVAATTQARLDIQSALSTALGNARIALQTYYGNQAYAPPVAGAPSGGQAPVVSRPAGFPVNVQNAARTASAAMESDPNYCASVAQPGSAVNTAVHAFKTAWNASQAPAVPVGTGNYEAATAAAIQQVVGSAPVACGAQPARPPPTPVHVVAPIAAAPAKGLSTGAVVGIGLLAATTVGGIAYAATRKRSVRRAKECCS
jgi:hypothetical protein